MVVVMIMKIGKMDRGRIWKTEAMIVKMGTLRGDQI
jgi:hypothetical protein